MDVSQIVDRVLQFALDEDDSTTSLREKVIEDINQAYKYILSRAANRNLDYNLKSAAYTSVEDSLAIPDYIKLYSVFDTTNGRKLVAKTFAQVQDMYPSMMEAGTPRYYYLIGDTLYLAPMASTPINVRVTYYEKANELTNDTLEADVRIPPMNDEVLVAGGKYFMAQREGGFHDKAEVAIRFQEFDEQVRELLRGIKALSPTQESVKGYYY